MKKFKKVVERPQLVIRRELIEESLKDFLEDNLGLKVVIYIDSRDCIYDCEEYKRATRGGGLVYNIRMGYGGAFYLEDNGYPIFFQGYNDGRIRIYKDKNNLEVTKKDFLKDLTELINVYNDGYYYGFVLFDENGVEIDQCGGFNDIEAIKQDLPEEWKNEDLSEYIINE